MFRLVFVGLFFFSLALTGSVRRQLGKKGWTLRVFVLCMALCGITLVPMHELSHYYDTNALFASSIMTLIYMWACMGYFVTFVFSWWYIIKKLD